MSVEYAQQGRLRPLHSAALAASLAAAEAAKLVELLGSCPTFELPARAFRAHRDLGEVSVLVLEEGFVVARTLPAGTGRPIVTCEAVDGGLVLPPGPGEVLEAIVDSRLTAVTSDVAERLLALPGAASAIVGELTAALRRKQDAIASFASFRHADRLHSKLRQLAGAYGRVTSDGVRLDLPLTHALLAEMVGSERETVTRALDDLERSGFLERHGKTYLLHVEPAALA